MSEAFKKETAGFVANERLFLTRDGKVVLDGDYRAAQLLSVKGGIVSEKIAKRLGLDKAKIEPLEKRPDSTPTPQAATKTVSPESIAERSTRPESPPARR